MAIVKYGQQVVWGTEGVNAQYGILTSYDEDSQMDSTPIEDENGDTVGLVGYNRRKSVTATWTAKSDATIPRAGDRVNLGGMIVIVNSAKKSRTNKGAMTISISGVKYDAF